MAALVTIEQVDMALRLDLVKTGSPETYVDERIPDVEMKIEEATDIALNYIKKPLDHWTMGDVPKGVQAAILLIITSLFDDFQQAEMLKGLSGGDLNNPIVALLYRHRDPALA